MKIDTTPPNIYQIYRMKEQEDGSVCGSYEGIILAKDEDAAIERWSSRNDINDSGLCQSQTGDWNWFGDAIEIVKLDKVDFDDVNLMYE